MLSNSLRVCIGALLLLQLALAGSNSPQTHINIGLYQGDNTVVSAGQVAARYRPGSPTPTTVDRFYPWVDLYITLTGGFGNSSQDFFASATNTNATLETTSVDLITSIGTVTPSNDAAVRVRMACLASGIDAVTVQIDFTGYDSVVIFWKKKCQVTGQHVGFSVATQNAATPASVPDVVANGQTAALWTGNDLSGLFVLYNQSISQQTFYLWMTHGYQPWTVVGDTSDFDKLDIDISPINGTAYPVTTQSSSFTVQFNCKVNAGVGFVSISLKVDPFDPVVFAWFKDCTGAFPPTPAPKPASGWSATGIFFFTVFLLTVFGCIGGCLFKFARQGARGMEMVPFIDTWRSLWAKISPSEGSSSSYEVFQSGVGPQAQFDSQYQQKLTSNQNSYGSSYQNL